MMSSKPLTPEWLAWIRSNLARGCTQESLVEAMVRDQFVADAARQAIQSVANESLAQRATASVAAPATPLAVAADSSVFAYEPSRLKLKGNLIETPDRQVQVSFRLERPCVALMANLLSVDECNELMHLASARLERSTVVDPKTGNTEVIAARSSRGTFFAVNENAFIARLDARIASAMNWPVYNGEGLQILRYDAGGEYRPHFDYFPPQDAGSQPHIIQSGQRVSTLIIYLNDVAEGGETIFPSIGLSVTPRQGSAVYFEYCNSQGQLDPATLHGGEPVRAGPKWIATKWMRERVYSAPPAPAPQ